MVQPNLFFFNLILFLNFEIERSNLNNNNLFLILIVIYVVYVNPRCKNRQLSPRKIKKEVKK